MQTYKSKSNARRPDRGRKGFPDRGPSLPSIKIAGVLPEQKALWLRAARVKGVSFACHAREALDDATFATLRDSRQHAEQAAERAGGAAS